MQALNVRAELRDFSDGAVQHPTQAALDLFASDRVAAGEWVEDDGDYYTRAEWDQEQADIESEDDWNPHAADNFRSWMEEPDPEEPDTDCHCNHPECGAC